MTEHCVLQKAVGSKGGIYAEGNMTGVEMMGKRGLWTWGGNEGGNRKGD